MRNMRRIIRDRKMRMTNMRSSSFIFHTSFVHPNINRDPLMRCHVQRAHHACTAPAANTSDIAQHPVEIHASNGMQQVRPAPRSLTPAELVLRKRTRIQFRNCVSTVKLFQS
jgi:hypothetical protein